MYFKIGTLQAVIIPVEIKQESVKEGEIHLVRNSTFSDVYKLKCKLEIAYSIRTELDLQQWTPVQSKLQYEKAMYFRKLTLV